VIPQGASQGVCEITMTPRFYNALCKCPTYQNNLGPCKTFEAGANGRCVWCDHEESCHMLLISNDSH
jgi:hypothetical protein